MSAVGHAVENLRIGFIGFGNMAQAICDGLLASGDVPATNLSACARTWERLAENAGMRGINARRSPSSVVEASDIVFVAVKPYLVESVLAPLRDELENKTLVSVAAGRDFAFYEGILNPGTHHISTVPNTPVAVREGVWICESKHSLDSDEYARLKAVLGLTGRVIETDSSLLGIAGTVTGCGPAFVAMFMEALADAAVKYGIPRALAYELAAQTTTGAGKLLTQTGRIPAQLKDGVCSPGGTTIRGVAALEEHGLRNAVIKAIDAIEG